MKGRQPTAVSPARARRRKTIIAIAGLSALFALFTLLALVVRRSAYTPLDLAFTRFLQSVDIPFGTAAMELLSWPGYVPQSLILSALAFVFLYRAGLRWESAALLSAVALEELLNILVKALIHRPRPSEPLVHVFVALRSYSFPSGHVMFYTCFFGFAWYLAFMMLRPSRVRSVLLSVFGVLVAAIGFSRIYLGEHWATDVLGAYLLGFAALIAGIQFYRFGKNRNLLGQKVARGRK